MGLRHAPVVLPALGFALGTILGLELHLCLYLPASLAALGFALGRWPGRTVAFMALGALSAAARLPVEPETVGLSGRPVEAVVSVGGHWRRGNDGWWVRAQVVRLRQGPGVQTPGLEVLVEVPAGERPPGYGSRLRLRGFLRRSPGYANRYRVGPGPWRLRLKSQRLLRLESEPPPWGRLSTRLRAGLEESWQRLRSSGAGPAVGRALVLGDAGRLEGAWLRGLRRCGLGHLLAVSGLHVGLVAAGPFLLPGLGRRVRWVASLGLVVTYGLLVGPRVSLLRATLMAAVALSAPLVERPTAALNALAWCVLVFLATDPGLVADLAFGLTVSAVAGLVTLGPLLARRWTMLPPWLGRPLAATAAAQVAILPWALPAFHVVNPLAPMWNLVFVPWTALTLAVSLLTMATGALDASLGGLGMRLLDLLAAPFGWPGLLPTRLSGAVPLASSVPGATLLAAAAVGILLAARHHVRLGCVVWLAAWGSWCSADVPGREMVVFDVGQGDAVLLRHGRRAVLVDGGGWRGEGIGQGVLLPALLAEGVRRLEAMILSHPDADHCRGLVEVAAYLPVEEVWTAPGWRRGGCVTALMTLPGSRVRVLWEGEEAAAAGWRFTALNPAPGPGGSRNARSLVLRAVAMDRSVLLTGDVDARGEARLVARWGGGLSCDILKVAHHGSRTSTGAAFLAAARPAWAVVSAGPSNPYGHPASPVLQRLGAMGIRVWRTDLQGAIQARFVEGGRTRILLPGQPR